MKKITFYLAAAVLLTLSSSAGALNKGLDVISLKPVRVGEQFNMEFLVNYGNIYLAPTEELHVTPLIAKGGDTVEMPSIIFTGNTKNRIDYRLARQYRKDDCNCPSDYDETLSPFKRVILPAEQIKAKRNCGTDIYGPASAADPTVAYLASIPYARWMNGADLMLKEELFTCSGPRVAQMQNIGRHVEVIQVEPRIVYVIPEVEEVKVREQHMTSHVTFQQDKYVIKPELSGNKAELDRIYDFVGNIKNNSNLDIKSIKLTGYASPEGSYSHNTSLAENRVKALKDNIIAKFDIGESVYTTSTVPEDWDSVKRWVAASDMQHKSQIIDIINNTSDPDARDARIRALDNGASYNKLYKEVYPGLRRTDFSVEYAVKAFTVETGKRIIITEPHNMSLHEMYMVANSYPENSAEFLNVYDVITRHYPDDPVANINIATAAIKKRDFAKARHHLEKVGDRAEAQNAIGIIYALEGNYTEAEKYFTWAVANGSSDAKYNLDHMRSLK